MATCRHPGGAGKANGRSCTDALPGRHKPLREVVVLSDVRVAVDDAVVDAHVVPRLPAIPGSNNRPRTRGNLSCPATRTKVSPVVQAVVPKNRV